MRVRRRADARLHAETLHVRDPDLKDTPEEFVGDGANIVVRINEARRIHGFAPAAPVGSEVLLRRDLPPAELMTDIDRVKAAVHQPVAYADVWNFWEQFPEVASHVDVVLIHLLPYWENTPAGIDHAVQHVDNTYKEITRLFPGKKIAIGETGWPSRGRERADAISSRVNEARFLRAFLTLSQQ